MTMKTLSTFIAGVAVLTALASPSLAAQRSRAIVSGDVNRAIVSGDVNTVRTYGDLDPANPPYRGSATSVQNYWGSVGNTGHPYRSTPGQNLPYPDRPYGDPDVD
jgi:hypothetical protein